LFLLFVPVFNEIDVSSSVGNVGEDFFLFFFVAILVVDKDKLFFFWRVVRW